MSEQENDGLPMPENVHALGKLTLAQERFVEAYETAELVVHAAREVDISERTAREWLQLPVIIEAIEQRRQERWSLLRNKLAFCMEQALEVVSQTLIYAANPDEAKKDGARIDSSRVDKYVALMLRYLHDQQEIETLKLRIALLEKGKDETGEV